MWLIAPRRNAVMELEAQHESTEEDVGDDGKQKQK